MKIKAITVQQPWAWAIAAASVDPLAKLVENRGRNTTHRGPVAILAGKRWSERGQWDRRVIAAAFCARSRGEVRYAWDVLGGSGLTFGAVIAVADLVDTHPAAGCCKPWGDDEYPGASQVWHWRLENVRRLPDPVPAAGALWLRDVELPDLPGITT